MVANLGSVSTVWEEKGIVALESGGAGLAIDAEDRGKACRCVKRLADVVMLGSSRRAGGLHTDFDNAGLEQRESFPDLKANFCWEIGETRKVSMLDEARVTSILKIVDVR